MTGRTVEEHEDTGASTPRANGTQAMVGVLMAVVGALAAANPSSAVLKAMNDAVPQLATAVPTLITACGALVAAFSHPPRLGRRSQEVK